MDLCEFEASLVYRVSSRTARIVNTEKPCLENKTKRKQANKDLEKIFTHNTPVRGLIHKTHGDSCPVTQGHTEKGQVFKWPLQ